MRLFNHANLITSLAMSQPQQLKGGDEDETVRSDRFAFNQRCAGVIDEEDKIVCQKRLANDLTLVLKELCVYQ